MSTVYCKLYWSCFSLMFTLSFLSVSSSILVVPFICPYIEKAVFPTRFFNECLSKFLNNVDILELKLETLCCNVKKVLPTGSNA